MGVLGRLAWQVVLAAVVVGLLAGGGVVAYLLAQPTEEQAVAACHELVAERLRSPASAIYDPQDVVEESRHSWSITGRVDSQNRFGAMVGGRYACAAVEPNEPRTVPAVELDDGSRWQTGGFSVSPIPFP